MREAAPLKAIVRLDMHIVETREVLDERVTRPRGEHHIARIAEQLEEQRVRLARAGRNDRALRRDRHAAPREVVRDGGARHRQAECARLVHERLGPSERLEKG